jgi:hypothetical protein
MTILGSGLERLAKEVSVIGVPINSFSRDESSVYPITVDNENTTSEYTTSIAIIRSLN